MIIKEHNYDFSTGISSIKEVESMNIDEVTIGKYLKSDIRMKRDAECFSIINRGQLWYSTLTEEQLIELNAWYQAWLNATETLVIPDKPIWLE